MKTLQGLYLTQTFQCNTIKVNIEAIHEYGRLGNEALFVPQEMLTILPSTLVFILQNIRSLRRHAFDIVSDLHLTKTHILFLPET